MAASRERDGIFETEDCIHVVEATTSLKKEKAENDATKTFALIGQFRKQYLEKAIKGWFVTSEPPTVDQIEAVRKIGQGVVSAVSFAELQRRLVDVNEYLDCRSKYAFGSARNPINDSFETLDDYVDAGLLQMDKGKVWHAAETTKALLDGGTFTILGDFGSGKSMTLREIYVRLEKQYRKGQISSFPLYVNLRDHQGQTDTDEILERHAKRIGFSQPSHLVRAWRAGYAIILLDGFDEFTPLGVQTSYGQIKKYRYDAMTALRHFANQTPERSGWAIAGRMHYFDGTADRRNCLGTRPATVEATVSDFSESQIAEYLKRKGMDSNIPAWLPSRPLLLGNLAARAASKGDSVLADATLAGLTAEEGWPYLILRIAEREARNEPGVDAAAIRSILERLASKVRRFAVGHGKLTRTEMAAAFEEVVGQQPDPRAIQMLLRLPGLAVRDDDHEARVFVDPDFADACATGDLVRLLVSPHDTDVFGALSDLVQPIGATGVAIVSRHCESSDMSEKQANSIISGIRDNAHMTVTLLDLTRAFVDMDLSVSKGLQFISLDLTGQSTHDWTDIEGVTFRDCYFGEIDVSAASESSFPIFYECVIGTVIGAGADSEPPKDKFVNCYCESFSKTPLTTNAAANLEDVPLDVRVALTILKKIYDQSGKARKENALSRGLDTRSKNEVTEVLRRLRKAQLIQEYNRGRGSVWQPVRRMRPRVMAWLANPVVVKPEQLFVS